MRSVPAGGFVVAVSFTTRLVMGLLATAVPLRFESDPPPMVNVALRAPAAVGDQRTESVQLPPLGATVVPQVPPATTWNSLALVPPNELAIVKGLVRKFCAVTVTVAD